MTSGTQYANISGTYTGNFTDAQVEQIPVVANIAQHHDGTFPAAAG